MINRTTTFISWMSFFILSGVIKNWIGIDLANSRDDSMTVCFSQYINSPCLDDARKRNFSREGGEYKILSPQPVQRWNSVLV